MGSAARGAFAVACVTLLGLAGGASAQILPTPIPPPPPPPDVPDLPTPPVPPVPSPGETGLPPGSPATPSTASGGGSGGGSTASGSGKGKKARANDTRTRTRFDRLPRRLEALLERIAAGRQLRGDLNRLERLLASMSPRMQARVLRLVQAEIRQLRGGGQTPAERRRIRRLQSVLEILRGGETGSAGAPGFEAPQPSTTSVTATGRTDPTAAPSSTSSQAKPPTTRGSLPAREGDSGRESDRSIFGLPASRWEIPLGVFIAFALLFVLSLGALVLAVAPPRTLPAGRLREVMKLQRAEVGFTGATTLAGLTLLLALTLLLGAPL